LFDSQGKFNLFLWNVSMEIKFHYICYLCFICSIELFFENYVKSRWN